VTNADFTAALARALRRPAIIPVPLFGLRLLFGEMSTILIESARVMPRAAQHAGFEFHRPELFGALKDVLS
jgi:NAD dependent epimerase/dehydratase family enzyme